MRALKPRLPRLVDSDMESPEKLLAAVLVEGQNFWTGRSTDARAFDMITRCEEPFASLSRACGYEAVEVSDGFVRWLECHPVHDE